MPLKRKKTSGVMVSIWSVLFLIGLGFVFLFLGGYRFSLQEKSFHRMGFVDFFARNASVYIDEVFVAEEIFFETLPLGKYDFCAENFTYYVRCFSQKQVRENAFPRLSLSNIFLQKKFQFPQKITEEGLVFHPKGLGVAWFDTDLKTLFWVEGESGEIFAKIPEKNLASLAWDTSENAYILSFDNGSTDYFSPFSENFFADISLNREKEIFSYGLTYIQEEREGEDVLFLGFNIPVQRNIDLSDTDARVLVFPSSVYLFLETDRQLKKIIQKDENTPIVFVEGKKEIFFQYSGALWKQEI